MFDESSTIGLTSCYSVFSLGTERADRLAASALPDLLTVEEAALLLRISRTKAYALTRQWRATGGATGLPVVDFGDTLRVPRQALERMLGVKLTGPLPARPRALGRARGSAVDGGPTPAAPAHPHVPPELPAGTPWRT
jgi:hypothetical protein